MSHRPGWPSTRGNPLTLWFATASTLTGGGGADRSHRQAAAVELIDQGVGAGQDGGVDGRLVTAASIWDPVFVADS